MDADLPDEASTVAEMYIDWIKTPKQPIIYTPGQYSDEPWLSNAAAAWLLGHQLDATRFQEYALSQFIQNCALVLRGPWKMIEESAPVDSPLRRFSNHWVAWDASLSGSLLNEYENLIAAEQADQVRSSTRDPRTLDLNHWYLDCGNDINAQCDHDPIFRANQWEKERLRKRAPPPVWGADYELANTSTTSNPADIESEIPRRPLQSRRARRQNVDPFVPAESLLPQSKALRKQVVSPLDPVEERLRSSGAPKSTRSSRASRRKSRRVEDWLRSNEAESVHDEDLTSLWEQRYLQPPRRR
ncbi:MAG: hypothetical protein L6R41_004325 [Letrouitia leprolyta]|nr:MAG: hypothetical protein L6R41_004325 [Letrouitia leprolyta]